MSNYGLLCVSSSTQKYRRGGQAWLVKTIKEIQQYLCSYFWLAWD